MAFRSLAVWNQAAAFHLVHCRQLVPIFPLLFCPILGDALQSVLIRQQLDEGVISPFRAVRQALSLCRALLPMKLYFEGAAVLYALIPIYGIIQDIRHRL